MKLKVLDLWEVHIRRYWHWDAIKEHKKRMKDAGKVIDEEALLDVLKSRVNKGKGTQLGMRRIRRG